MNINNCWLLPKNKEGEPDQRFKESLYRILEELGDKRCEELKRFAIETSHLQRDAAKSGLELAKAIFNEANYLEKNCKHDPNNQYGWRSKLLRKQAQEILENIGFKRNNANKLVKTAEWLTSASLDSADQEWVNSLSPSHLYELSRMSTKALEAVKKEVSHEGFHFSAGQQDISVRRLEELRRFHASTKCTPSEDNFTRINQLQPAIDSSASSNLELVEQLIELVKEIDWSHPTTFQRLREYGEPIRQLLQAIETSEEFQTHSLV